MQLVAAALFFMFSVCLVPEHKAAVLSAGALTAILAGYARHATDDDVMTTFRDIVEVCTRVCGAGTGIVCPTVTAGWLQELADVDSIHAAVAVMKGVHSTDDTLSMNEAAGTHPLLELLLRSLIDVRFLQSPAPTTRWRCSRPWPCPLHTPCPWVARDSC